MALYSDEVLDEVRSRNEIVDVVSGYVRLRQKGGNYFGLCPFHREKSPSFSVSADKQIFHCFGCGAGGNVITFIMRIENLGFTDAVKHLADRVHMTLPESEYDARAGRRAAIKDAIYDANVKAARFYYGNLSGEAGELARDYLKSRRVSTAIVKKFGLGYATPGWDALYRHLSAEGFDDEALEQSGLVIKTKSGFGDKFRGRLMFPIMDAQSRVVGFGGRVLMDGGPKYLNSPDTPVFNKSRNLFAMNYARKTKEGSVLVVEGYMDALSLYQYGFDNAVASLGTAFNRDHCRVLNQYLRGKTVFLLFDSDKAGESAALRAIPILRQQNIDARVLALEGAKDPDEFLRSFGKEAMEAALQTAKKPAVFHMDVLRKHLRPERTMDPLPFLNAAAAVVAETDNAMERDIYINALSKETGVSAEAIRGQAERAAASGPGELSGFVIPAHAGKPAVLTAVPEYLMEAGRNVLYWAAMHINLYESIRDALTPEEIPYPPYAALYNEIIKTWEAGRTPAPGELIGRFEELSDQEAVSAVFSRAFPYEDEKAVRRALNDHIGFLKNDWINRQITEAKNQNDYERVQALGKIQRNPPKSYI